MIVFLGFRLAINACKHVNANAFPVWTWTNISLSTKQTKSSIVSCLRLGPTQFRAEKHLVCLCDCDQAEKEAEYSLSK